MGKIELRFIEEGTPEYAEEHELRYRILREPLSMGRHEVVGPREAECLHLVAIDEGQVVGCVLFLPNDATQGRLLQMAVDSNRQGEGIGRQLVRTLEETLVQKGFTRIYLHGRGYALHFYKKLGYTIYGEPFEEVGISHRLMERRIGPDPS